MLSWTCTFAVCSCYVYVPFYIPGEAATLMLVRIETGFTIHMSGWELREDGGEVKNRLAPPLA